MGLWGISRKGSEMERNSLGFKYYVHLQSTGIGLIRVCCGVWPGGTEMSKFFVCVWCFRLIARCPAFVVVQKWSAWMSWEQFDIESPNVYVDIHIDTLNSLTRYDVTICLASKVVAKKPSKKPRPTAFSHHNSNLTAKMQLILYASLHTGIHRPHSSSSRSANLYPNFCWSKWVEFENNWQ